MIISQVSYRTNGPLVHFQITRLCQVCGVIILDPNDLRFHELLHELDLLDSDVSD